MILFSSAGRQHFLDQQPQASHPGLALVGPVVGHEQEIAEASGLLLQVRDAVGDLATLVSPAEGLNGEEFKQRFAEWMKAQREAGEKMQAAMNDEKERAKAQQRIQELYQQRMQFMKEERTGFVWLYLRK